MKTKSEIKHYYVGELLFVDYMDAYNYCVKNLISPDNIVSSYYYRVNNSRTTIKTKKAMKTKTFEDFLKTLSIYDNGGKTYDRITIVFNDTKRKTADGYLYTCIGCSLHGVGFFEHSDAQKGRHLGKKISFEDLSKELQQTLKNYFND